MRHFKNFIFLSLLLILTACKSNAANTADVTAEYYSTEAPETFTKGVNLTGWFEIWSKGIPNLNLYSKKDFEDLKAMGCDVVRLPIHFDMVVDENYQIEEIIFTYLDKVCDWAEELQMHLVIDDHSFNSGEYPSAKEVRAHLTKVWPQIVARYKNRSRYIIFEILNEPQLKNLSDWESIQKDVLNLIRKQDTRHTVVVTGNEWGSLNAMLKLSEYKDTNLIYTFHCYDPFLFTHQGASWTSQGDLAGVPFPYDESRIPEVASSLKGTYIENNLHNGEYKRESDPKTLKDNLSKAADFSAQRNVPVWCGEMGCYSKAALHEDRVAWYQTMGSIMQELNLPFSIWGYDDQFGFFYKDSEKEYPWDLDVQMVDALGLKVPGSYPERTEKDNSVQLPFTFYDDLTSKYVSLNMWTNNNTSTNSSSSKDNPAEGAYCIRFGNVNRYNNVGFYIKEVDFSSLKDKTKNTYLHFYVRFTDSSQQLQYRFNDEDDVDNGILPWRLGGNLKASSELNKWTLVEIPLSDLTLLGAWSSEKNKWFSAGKDSEFDWNNVKSFSFNAEDAEIKGDIFLDDIRLIEK